MIVLEAFVTNRLKLVVGRVLPPAALVSALASSFPSEHVMRAVVVLGLLPSVVYAITRHRIAFWLCAVGMVAGIPAVAYSRIFLGVHWPSDVVERVLIGALLLFGAERFLACDFAGARCAAVAGE